MGRKVVWTEEEVAEALIKTGGFITETTKVLGYKTVDSLYKYIDRSELLQKTLKTVRRKYLDLAHSGVIKQIAGTPEIVTYLKDKKGEFVIDKHGQFVVETRQSAVLPNFAAMAFYLKCQGKDDGWVERQEITGKNGDAFEIKARQMSDKELDSAIDKLIEERGFVKVIDVESSDRKISITKKLKGGGVRRLLKK